jgi:hypothetical protein
MLISYYEGSMVGTMRQAFLFVCTFSLFTSAIIPAQAEKRAEQNWPFLIDLILDKFKPQKRIDRFKPQMRIDRFQPPKQVGHYKLKLSAPDVAGTAGESIPLKLILRKTKQENVRDQKEILVSIKGIPRNAHLFNSRDRSRLGTDVGGGQWLLPPSRLENLAITVPPGASGTFVLQAQLLRDDAQTPLSQPVSFKLTIGRTNISKIFQSNSSTPQGKMDYLTQVLIRDGNKHMHDGDIVLARRLYKQAITSGHPEAYLVMGHSYDPVYFKKQSVKTGKPDPNLAFYWYKKALDAESPTAQARIERLKLYLRKN